MKCDILECPKLSCPKELQFSVTDECCKFCPGDYDDNHDENDGDEIRGAEAYDEDNFVKPIKR